MLKTLLFVLLLLCIGKVNAEVPEFVSINKLQANDSAIVIEGGIASPGVTDWNGDGKKDLLVGQFAGGKIRLYLNSGTNSAPVFTSFTYLKADGSEISVFDSICLGASNPQVEDFNGDGIKDLIVGDQKGVIHFFSRNSSGDLHFETLLKRGVSTINLGPNSSPEIADWNEDGLLDLLLGSEPPGGPVMLFINSGTKTEYKFESQSIMYAEGRQIAHFRDQICVADLNINGKKDLLVADATGHIYFYENIGTNESPQLKIDTKLHANGELICLDRDTRLCVADWNEDGAYDIIAGDLSENVYLILGKSPNNIIYETINFHERIELYPKTDGLFLITIFLDYTQNVTFNLFSFSGKLIGIYDCGVFNNGENIVKLNLNEVTKGIYLLKCNFNNKRNSYKLVYAR